MHACCLNIRRRKTFPLKPKRAEAPVQEWNGRRMLRVCICFRMVRRTHRPEHVSFAAGLDEYTGLCDFLGSDQYSWAFNQVMRPTCCWLVRRFLCEAAVAACS
jgi:hypothetical protein